MTTFSAEAHHVLQDQTKKMAAVQLNAALDQIEDCPDPGNCRVAALIGCLGAKGTICECGLEVLPVVTVKLVAREH